MTIFIFSAYLVQINALVTKTQNIGENLCSNSYINLFEKIEQHKKSSLAKQLYFLILRLDSKFCLNDISGEKLKMFDAYIYIF